MFPVQKNTHEEIDPALACIPRYTLINTPIEEETHLS